MRDSHLMKHPLPGQGHWYAVVSDGYHCLLRSMLLFGLLLYVHAGYAQEPLMAKGNKVLSISYGAGNAVRKDLSRSLSDQQAIHPGYIYQLGFTNPLQASFDMALSDYTTAGIAASWCRFRVKENGQFSQLGSELETKGYKLTVQVRGIRYLVQGQRMVCYFFGAAGLRLRGITYSSSDLEVNTKAYSHQVSLLSANPYKPFSLEAGLGLKFLLTSKVGLSVEAGALTGIAQLGLFYSLKNKWRKSNDQYGW